MRIHVFDPDENTNIKLIFPTALICNNLSASLFSMALDKSSISTNGKELFNDENKKLIKTALKESFAFIREFKKKNPHFVLVDVEGAKGEKVFITL